MASSKAQRSPGRPAGSPKKRAEKRPARAEEATPPPPSATWNLRLYVAGDSPKSRNAIENLQRLCEKYLVTGFEIEVVDLKQKPELAKADQILAVPTLIRKIPEPMKRVIGDLSNADRALLALDLGASEGS